MKSLARKIFGLSARFQGKNRPEWIKEYNQQRNSFPSSRICYAPDRSIFFASDGMLYSCCFNRTDSTGWYNSRSVNPDEKARQDLSLRLHKNDFPRGCNICSSAVHSKNYAAVGAALYDHPGFGNIGFPSFLEFELSTRCNLDCIMCPDTLHTKIPGEIMDLRPLRKITGNYTQVRWAKFYGGEPFLTDAYFDIWEDITNHNKAAVLKVQTNGTVLNDKVKSVLEKGNFSINISIDSLNPEVYEVIRKGASFSKTMENLEYFAKLSERKKRPLSISVCPMKMNACDLPGLMRFCCERKFNINFNTLTEPAEFSLKYSRAEELTRLYQDLEKEKFYYSGSISHQNLRHWQSFLQQLKAWREASVLAENEPHKIINLDYLREIIGSVVAEERKPWFISVFKELEKEFTGDFSVSEKTLAFFRGQTTSSIGFFAENNSTASAVAKIRKYLMYGIDSE